MAFPKEVAAYCLKRLKTLTGLFSKADVGVVPAKVMPKKPIKANMEDFI
jgi:hypothetical protein